MQHWRASLGAAHGVRQLHLTANRVQTRKQAARHQGTGCSVLVLANEVVEEPGTALHF